MAYLEARAGIGRAGVTYAGYAAPRFKVYVNSVDCTTKFNKTSTWMITDTVDETPSTFRARVTGMTPTVGHRVDVLHCTPDEYLFSGHILRTTARVQLGQPVQYDIEAVDATYLLDRVWAPTGRHRHVGINTLISDWCGNRGTAIVEPVDLFQPGHIDASLGDVPDLHCDGMTPLSAIVTRLAKSVGAYWRVNPGTRTIDIFTTNGDADGNKPTLTNTSAIRDLTVTRDATQLRNEVRVVGSGGSTVSPVAATATTLQVTEGGWYDPASGTNLLLIDGNLCSYTDISPTTGQATMSGFIGVDDIAENTIVRPEYRAADYTAKADWASALGVAAGLETGTQAVWVRAFEHSQLEATSLATAQLAMYKQPLTSIQYITQDRWVRPGQCVSASITSPASVTGTFVVQRVETVPRIVTQSVVAFDKRVSAGTYLKGLTELLAKLG